MYTEYCELLEYVKANFEYRERYHDCINAVKIKNEQDFETIRRFFALAYSPSCGYFAKADVKGLFEGEDWYFIESSEEQDMGARITEYWIESLTHKKEIFARFCAEYE